MNPQSLHRLHSLRVTNEQRAADMAEARPTFDKLRHRHENGTAPRAVSAWQLFQTPETLAAQMVQHLPEHAARILEPSAGLGRLIHATRQRFPAAALTAIEEAPQLAGELFALQAEGVTLLQRDFLTVTPEPGELFDAAIMNPPFHMRADIKHTRHALTFLKPGGKLVGLCMDTRHRREALQPLADHWQEIPAGAFRSEGTNIPTILFSITK